MNYQYFIILTYCSYLLQKLYCILLKGIILHVKRSIKELKQRAQGHSVRFTVSGIDHIPNGNACISSFTCFKKWLKILLSFPASQQWTATLRSSFVLQSFFLLFTASFKMFSPHSTIPWPLLVQSLLVLFAVLLYRGWILAAPVSQCLAPVHFHASFSESVFLKKSIRSKNQFEYE